VQLIKRFECEDELLKILLEQVKSPVRSWRAAGAALLLLQLYTDFSRNRTIVMPSISFQENLTSTILQVPRELIRNYESAIAQIVPLAAFFKNNEFTRLVKGCMDAAQVIIDVLKKQRESNLPAEVRAEQVMSIANQYKSTPTMRLKWLGELLRINRAAGDVISAFVTQLHIIALIATVFKYNRDPKGEAKSERQRSTKTADLHFAIVQPFPSADDSQSVFDFSFMPEVTHETEIRFTAMRANDLRLLSNETFSAEHLLEELERGVKLALEAKLPYSARPILALQMRVGLLLSDFKMIATACRQLAEAFNQIKLMRVTQELHIAYLLVEVRKAQKITRHVFCWPGGPDSHKAFLAGICTSERFGNLRVSLCTSHAGCKADGVCVIPVHPVNEKPLDAGEDMHCWSDFRAVVDQLPDPPAKLKVVWVRTKAHLPHYCMTAEVTDFKWEELSLTTLARTDGEKIRNALEQIALAFVLWSPPKMRETERRGLSEILVLVGTLEQLFGPTVEVIQRIQKLWKFSRSMAKDIAEKLMKTLDTLMKGAIGACSTLRAEEEYKPTLTKYDEAIRRFAEQCELGQFISYDPVAATPTET
jgi:hypothetical protein